MFQWVLSFSRVSEPAAVAVLEAKRVIWPEKIFLPLPLKKSHDVPIPLKFGTDATTIAIQLWGYSREYYKIMPLKFYLHKV